ncbi:AAA family ATPase [Escherichia coli]|nr:hypothetical protein BvCmsHHNP016_01405 [Escherichia coli]
MNHKNTTIQTISPYNPYPISFDDENLLKTPVIDSSNSYLSETIKKLQNLDWVKKGKENYLVGDICPFCQKETIDDKFTEALEQIFDESYAQKITSIEKLKYIYELTTQEQLQLLKTQLNDCTAISIEERKTSLAHISSLEKMLKSNIELINNKIQNPSLSVTLDKDKDIEESLLKDIKQYNSRINDLNEKVKQFNLTQDKIKNQFWGALRNYCNTDFEVLEKIQAENDIIIKSLEESIDSINKEIKHTDDEIKELRNKTSNIDATISSINSKLKNLGITCFYIDKHPTIKNSFVIVRSDNTPSKNVYRSLSEGEKTLITFLYFIEYCKGQTNTDEFDNRDSLIVIDDPISSLSQNYIYDIASMIHYDIFTSANKVIILTHNLYFFHELIKLAPISERKFNSTYQLFRITKNLHSSFSNISRDSLQNEYQSLWQILKDARDGKVHNVVIPNTMRNILEYYFAFVHKTNELQDELNKLAQNESNSNFKAFYRYINRGSHSDSINITDMGEITPDIYITQFKEIFRLMGDISHFNKMYEEKKNIEDTTA